MNTTASLREQFLFEKEWKTKTNGIPKKNIFFDCYNVHLEDATCSSVDISDAIC